MLQNGMKAAKKSEDTRNHILSVGRDMVLTGGFGGVGLKALLERCCVPKGSFYYYFSSKEAFGCCLLQDYVEDYLRRMDTLFALPESGGAKLMRFWSAWLEDDESGGIADRCLVVKLAAEISDLSEDMRAILDDGVAQLVERVAQLLEEGAIDGSLQSQADPKATAGIIYAQWLGAAVLAKLSKSKTPLQQALSDTRARLEP